MPAMLDLDLLRSFHMIARLGRFRAAAERLNKSPAAISVQVQRLEAVAGGRLFERDNRAVVLTPLGQRLLAGTTELLRVHDRLMDELQDTGPAGKVRLGVPDEYAGHVIRDILPVIVARWPRVVLEVETAASGVLTDQFQRGRLDMVVIVRPAGGEHDGRYLVATTPVWVAAPAALAATIILARLLTTSPTPVSGFSRHLLRVRAWCHLRCCAGRLPWVPLHPQYLGTVCAQDRRDAWAAC